MFSQTPELYDAVYGAFKDYEEESRRVARLLQELAPGAREILDVACGTGEHARHLQRDHGYRVTGLDIERAFVELARAKVPEAAFHHADMSRFDLGTRFDAVVCLFSSIGYLIEPERLDSAFRCFADHLKSGGVAVIEPWLTPADWNPGQVHVHRGETGDVQVVRMSHSSVEDRISRIEFHYLVGSVEGVEYRVEEHRLALREVSEVSDALERAGFESVRFDEEGLNDRGVILARRAERR
ncbi:MAG: methyltransferase domain-containing protein [Longimicrobiales bacterium]|nr:methyltransferase domain-containing protein [Longimicrobiales bacterium]